VTREGFIKARDQLLDEGVPWLIQGLREVYGKVYDVDGLADYLRSDGQRFLKEAALVFFEATARHASVDEQNLEFARLARRYGLDMLDPDGTLLSGERTQEAMTSFLRHRVALGVRHRDRSRLSNEEISEILEPAPQSGFSKAWEAYEKQHEKRLVSEFLPLVLQMTGPYNAPFAFFGTGPPRFAFEAKLPGILVETNGKIVGPGRVRWTFAADESFPGGYVMSARSLEFDLPGQAQRLAQVSSIPGPGR
jgi:hypothetical protein